MKRPKVSEEIVVSDGTFCYQAKGIYIRMTPTRENVIKLKKMLDIQIELLFDNTPKIVKIGGVSYRIPGDAKLQGR